MKRLYVLGDSISIDYGPHLQRYLHGTMAYARKEGEAEARLNLDRPQGANGGDSSMVLDFLRKSGRLPADVLLLNCGLHDIKTDPATGTKQVPLDQYRQNLQAILTVVHEMKLSLVWVRTTPADERVHNTRPNMAFHRFRADNDAYNAAADTIMRAAGIPIIDLHAFTLALGSDLYRDHVHFHPAICQLQAAYLAGWLIRFAA